MDGKKERKEKQIISLDDFGLNEKANANILKLILSKKIDRVAVIGDGNISDDEAKVLLSSEVKLDVHLHLAENASEIKKLNGVFGRIILFLLKYIFGRNRTGETKEKWEKQIMNFKNKFHKNPDGLNSHEHIHFFPPYFKVALEICKEYNIGYIRLGYKNSKGFSLVSPVLNFLRAFNKRILAKSSISSSDFMVSADWFKNFNFKITTSELNPDVFTEIIFHPEREEEFIFLEKILPNR